MRCFGKKDERKSSSPPAPSAKRRQQQNRHHSEPQSSEYWNKVNGIGGSGSGKKVKKRRKNSSATEKSRRRMSEAMATQNGTIGNGKRQTQTQLQGGPLAREMSATSVMEGGGGGGGLEYNKITERIFALIFPSGSDSSYRQSIKSTSERIKRTFPDRYKIFNLSQKRSDLGRSNQQGAVLEFGWPDTLAPPLDRLCSICKQLENHLNASAENVAIIHCKGGVYRAGIVIAAFMNYTNICTGEESLADRFSMKLFTDKYLDADTQPSYKRYVKYFANLLSGSTKVYPSPVWLTQISLNQLFTGQKMVKLKLYERMKPVWSSGRIMLNDDDSAHSPLLVNLSRLSLRGDVLLKCYEPSTSASSSTKDGHKSDKMLLFQCQFNTCAIGLDTMPMPKMTFHKHDLDIIFNDNLVDNGASVGLLFELPSNTNFSGESRRSNTPKRGKSASPGRANQQNNGSTPGGGGGGDFSRADSYENFDRDEDDRSLSLPFGSINGPQSQLPEKADNANGGNGAKQQYQHIPIIDQQQETTLATPLLLDPHLHHHNSSKQTATSSVPLPTPLTTDGADSGIGSDSPKGAAAATATINGNGKTQNEGEYADIVQIKKMPPPPVPPKLRRHSSIESVEDQQNNPPPPHYAHAHANHQPLPLPPPSHYDDSPAGEDDPLRGAFEDSTIGRDHSVLPPGVRPNRRHSTHQQENGIGGAGGNSGSSGEESRPQKRVIISPMVQPQLVASGRYDPNSRCFSYVPAKSLKEHYQAPKKPALKRRTSIVEPADLEVSPLEAKMALQNFGLQGSSGDLRRRAETPKWEAEIDKVTGKIGPFPERRPRRASTSGTPVGHLQGDYVRSPSAQIRPQNEWHQQQHRHPPQPQSQHYHNQPQYHQPQHHHRPQYPPSHWNWSEPEHRKMPNGYLPSGTGAEGWTTPVNSHGPTASHTVPRMQQPSRGDHFYPMAASMPAEKPTVIEQAKRATPTPVARYSPQLRSSAGKRIPGVRPTIRRSEMDELLDPEFYLTYSTPTSSPALGRKHPPTAAGEEGRRAPQQQQAVSGEVLSKSVPNDRAFRQIGQKELFREDVRDLLAQHTAAMGGNRNSTAFSRAQTPQNAMNRIGSAKYGEASRGGLSNDEFRARHSRSVNSTPLIGARKMFIHDLDEPSTDPEERGADSWLHSKMAALRNRRYMEPMARNRREAEKMLLEELKSKAAKMIEKDNGGQHQQRPRQQQQHEREGREGGGREGRGGGGGGGGGGGDPLVEEYRREEQRLRNTQSPMMVFDGLRQANRTLQKERARQGYYGQTPTNAVPQPIARSFPSGTEYSPHSTAATTAPSSHQGQFRSLSVTPGSAPSGGGGGISSFFSASSANAPSSRSFHQPIASADSPTPSSANANNIRRGATPTSQIVRGKPPTPPPIRIDREHSKSPYSGAGKLLRGSSNSAPPLTASAKRGGGGGMGIGPNDGDEPPAAVNPSLLALRQSLYAKERERMGIEDQSGGGGGGRHRREWISDDEWEKPTTNQQWANTSTPMATPTTANGQQMAGQRSNRPNNHNSSSTFSYGIPSNTNNSNNGGDRSTPVKPILKRTNGNGNGLSNGNGGGTTMPSALARSGNESPMIQRKQLMHNQKLETPDEESSVQPSRRPLSGHPPSSNWLTERSDTPQFPVQSDRETPLPYHPLLYRSDENNHHQQQQGMPPTAKTSNTMPMIGGGGMNNNNNNRFGAMTPHSMYGGIGHNFSRRSSLTSIGWL